MTLQAVEPARVTIDPQNYDWCIEPTLADRCAMPFCSSRFKLQKHHIVRRTATGGPKDFVTIDGLVVQNVCMLCREHHEMITGSIGGHKLWIIYENDAWQVYRPDTHGYMISKNGAHWVWCGILRMGNHG